MKTPLNFQFNYYMYKCFNAYLFPMMCTCVIAQCTCYYHMIHTWGEEATESRGVGLLS